MNKKFYMIVIITLFISLNIFPQKRNILSEDVGYLKKLLEECYAGYDYNVENGVNFDLIFEKARDKYLKTVLNKGEDNKEILATIISEEIIKKVSPDNHLYVSTENKHYGISRHVWSYSDFIIEEKKDGFYVFYSSENSIPEGSKYTGNYENLFPCYFGGNKKYYIGILSEKYEDFLRTSFDNKIINLPLYYDNVVQKYGWVGCKKTKDTFYLSIGDCDFYNGNKMKHDEITKKLDSYLQDLKNGNYENIIIDLRGNNGGTENNLLPILLAIDSKKSNQDKTELILKIRSLRNGERSYFSSSINTALHEYYKNNPGIKIYNMDEYVKKSEEKRFEVAKFNESSYSTDFKGNIFILFNGNTASAAEQIITDFQIFDNVCLLGSNTLGGNDFESSLDYKLPNSKLIVTIPSCSNKYVEAIQNDIHWHGDTYGFFPDYWCASFDILPTLIELTNDEELEVVLEGLESDLL